MAQQISLGADGFFRRGGAPFVPVGVNYRLPEAARAEDIRADLAAMEARGLNAVRVRSSTEGAALELAGASALAIFADDAELGDGVTVCEFSARPGGHGLGFDGLTDPFFHTFLPFALQAARLRRPTIVLSLGVGAALSARAEETWLQAALPAARRTGAAGFFWREWRGVDGLLDDAGRSRPGREVFAAGLAAAIAPSGGDAEEIGVFVPASGDMDPASERRLMLAHYFLGVIGRTSRLVTRVAGIRSLLIAGVPVSSPDRAELRAWVEAGGELFWHGPDPLAWDDNLAALLGARPGDWRSGRGISVNAFGERFTLAHFPHDVRTELELAGATVLAADHQGFALLLENRVGGGRVRYALPIVEDAIVPVAAHPTSRDRWASWYRGLLTP